MKVRLRTPFGDIIIELKSEWSPRTVKAIWEFLPMKYSVPVQIWGKEFFFYLPDTEELINVGYENARIRLRKYDVAFWPRDPAICVFYGRTPVSRGEEPEAAEKVNVIGRVVEGFSILERLTDGDLVIMEKM
ncbi:MAG: cyclophilin-like family protein [Candidatus Helarchaeota archaeon]